MTIKLSSFDAAKYFDDADSQNDLLDDAFATGDAAYIKNALNTVARARGMTKVEEQTGIKRQAIYRALGEHGNPTLETLLKVTLALGYRLSVAPRDAVHAKVARAEWDLAHECQIAEDA